MNAFLNRRTQSSPKGGPNRTLQEVTEETEQRLKPSVLSVSSCKVDRIGNPSDSLRASVQIRIVLALSLLFLAAVIAGTVRDPHFWLTADQKGDRLMKAGKFAEAAKAYADPWHIGAAQFRNGDFKAAAASFARVPGAVGAFDRGNAWLMAGAYDAAVESYDRALGFRPGWKDAAENKALALARKAAIDNAGKDADQEQTGQDDKPDEIVFDQKKQGEDKKSPPIELAAEQMSDEQLRATWLRRVQTTPGAFLRAKFSYQAADIEQKDAEGAKEGQ
jgi:Ca-activated chloride channel family protein